MSLVDPRAGRAFIWIVSSLLFFSVMAGGGCLLMYMILPESETSAWLPVAGLSLVCLPWFFWFLTFVYRIFSRACGFRVSLGVAAAPNVAAPANANAQTTQADCDSPHAADHKRNSSSSTSSAESRESEMPFAIAMVS